VAALEAWLAHYADLLEDAAGTRARDIRDPEPRAGPVSACSALHRACGHSSWFPESTSSCRRPASTNAMAGADLVITGEGRIDDQTAYGKTALGVARRAAASGVPCLAVGGGVLSEGVAALPRWERSRVGP